MTADKTETPESLIDRYTGLLWTHIRDRMPAGRRTFGFEYEFMPEKIIDMAKMEKLYLFLETIGYKRENGSFKKEQKMEITFEPGGQIEYHSVPLLADDDRLFHLILADIQKTNQAIETALGIRYIPVGYIAGRGEAPLCLASRRYLDLHRRLGTTGSRGREMMKGTASIHLHVVIRNMAELVPLFLKMRDYLVTSELLSMKRERRHIWNNTDPVRCGLPFKKIESHTPPEALIREFVRVSVYAEELASDLPFYQLPKKDFNRFLMHHTTVFTDIRLNAKGPTLELRTPESVDTDTFERMWKFFTEQMRDVCD